ncbi:hypothetical protein [Magnetospirillum sp. UT-4]|uniref:hypothetical protein n=1 Tax=Magnetospirillum sp. UT-4 TaxID=2681467 RepID=UPI00137F7CC6|nr:hypothetical protein [Magnetospirillum sp. UT-4]CAA7616671.1 Secreted protein [Magnetospirillum sp. UT-4]
MRVRLLALGLILAATPAFAQQQEAQPAAPTSQQARFQDYLQQAGYKNMLGQFAMMGDAISYPECKQREPAAHTIVAIFVPPNFTEALHPNAGRWVDRVMVKSCGAEHVHNVLLQAQPDNKPPAAQLRLPGVTATVPSMQDKIVAEIIALLAKQKCTDQAKIIPVDTKKDKELKALKMDQGKVVDGAWRETWLFRACGKKVSASVELTADGKGGFAHKVKM